jgi:hypothetical protein
MCFQVTHFQVKRLEQLCLCLNFMPLWGLLARSADRLILALNHFFCVGCLDSDLAPRYLNVKALGTEQGMET